MDEVKKLVSSIMTPKSKILYAKKDETLGPLTLDRLYRYGAQHFPVVDAGEHIIGILHTSELNLLNLKDTPTVADVLDRRMYYLRSDYKLSQAFAAFLRTGCPLFLVVDRENRIVGTLAASHLLETLLGTVPSDDFDQDSDRAAVANRKV